MSLSEKAHGGDSTPSECVISIVLAVKNGMPYMPQVLESIGAQQYEHFEVIVQDSVSTDGTSECCERYIEEGQAAAKLRHFREEDRNQADGMARGLARARGDVVGFLDADVLLSEGAFAQVAQLFSSDTELGVLYGAQRIIMADGRSVDTYVPAPYNVLDVLDCTLVPPFASSYFSLSRCRDVLTFDASLPTCPDYDVWLRVREKKVVAVRDVFSANRLSEKSGSCHLENYESFCEAKIMALQKHLSTLPHDAFVAALERRATAGIYLWAATSVLGLFGRRAEAQFLRYLRLAEKSDPLHPRLREILQRLQQNRVDGTGKEA